MNTMLIRLLLCGALSLPLTSPSVARAQTQQEMNQEAGQAFKAADAALNKAFKQLMAKLDKEGQEELKAAQVAWVVFRDADAKFAAGAARGGSMASMVHEEHRATLTKTRAEDLKSALADRDK